MRVAVKERVLKVDTQRKKLWQLNYFLAGGFVVLLLLVSTKLFAMEVSGFNEVIKGKVCSGRGAILKISGGFAREVGKTVDECAAWCNEVDHCHGFTYREAVNSDNKVCLLHENFDNCSWADKDWSHHAAPGETSKHGKEFTYKLEDYELHTPDTTTHSDHPPP